MNLFYLRIQKWFFSVMYSFVYPNIPFSMAYTEFSTEYDYSGLGGKKILAEFDCNNKHWVIIKNEDK